MSDIAQQVRELTQELQKHQHEAQEKMNKQTAVRSEIKKFEEGLEAKKKEDLQLTQELKHVLEDEKKINAELTHLEGELKNIKKKAA